MYVCFTSKTPQAQKKHQKINSLPISSMGSIGILTYMNIIKLNLQHGSVNKKHHRNPFLRNPSKSKGRQFEKILQNLLKFINLNRTSIKTTTTSDGTSFFLPGVVGLIEPSRNMSPEKQKNTNFLLLWSCYWGVHMSYIYCRCFLLW